MPISRKEFLNIAGGVVGSWMIAWTKSKIPGESLAGQIARLGNDGLEAYDRDPDSRSTTTNSTRVSDPVLDQVGYFNQISPKRYIFDENKYSDSKRKITPSEWDSTNRHLPIKITPQVINKPGERSPQALERIIEYTQFRSPRYVAAAGERASMCNIAAWDWSRALQLHLPHWIGETEMSANMLYRWISHPQAGGVYGEGWQPVYADVARRLANLGIPVFALVENTRPRRHGHVAMVYPKHVLEAQNNQGGIYFATVTNGRSRGGNGIKDLNSTFRNLKPTYFVHKVDFILYPDS